MDGILLSFEHIYNAVILKYNAAVLKYNVNIISYHYMNISVTEYFKAHLRLNQ